MNSMTNKSLNEEVSYLLTSYNERKITRDVLIVRAKAIFYSVLEQQDISLDAISIYYVISSIVDNSDLSDIEFDELINYLSGIIDGKCSYSHLMAIQLPKGNDEFINKINKIICGIQGKQIISSCDRAWLSNFFSSRLENLTTLSDLLIERIGNILRMLDIDIPAYLNTNVISEVHIASEERYKEDLIDSINNYINCLNGKRCVFISVCYETNITVNII